MYGLSGFGVRPAPEKGEGRGTLRTTKRSAASPDPIVNLSDETPQFSSSHFFQAVLLNGRPRKHSISWVAGLLPPGASTQSR